MQSDLVGGLQQNCIKSRGSFSTVVLELHNNYNHAQAPDPPNPKTQTPNGDQERYLSRGHVGKVPWPGQTVPKIVVQGPAK